MKKVLLSVSFVIIFCLSNIAQQTAKTLTQPVDTKIDYIAERNYQLIFKELSKSGNVSAEQVKTIQESYQNNTLASDLQHKILESYIEDSDYKSWPSDIKELGLHLLRKYEKENPKVIPFYKQGRKPTIRQIGTLMNKAVPELDSNSGVVLSMNQQIQLVRERMPVLMSK